MKTRSRIRRRTWGYTWNGHPGYLPNVRKMVALSETKGMEILVEYGFTHLVLLSKIYPKFPFDIIGEDKFGKKAVFDVTMTVSKKVEKQIKVANAFGCNFYLVFISPINFDRHYLVGPISTEKKVMYVPIWNLYQDLRSTSREVGYEQRGSLQ